jgi:hypothetical protein
VKSQILILHWSCKFLADNKNILKLSSCMRILRIKVMLRFLLIPLIALTSTVFAQSTGLPDFTSLVEKHGAAVVNISAAQNTNLMNNQMIPEIQGLP